LSIACCISASEAALAVIGNAPNTDITNIAAIKSPIPFFLVSIFYLLLFFTYEGVYKTFGKKLFCKQKSLRENATLVS
jgi:hypothetical protein